MAVVLLEFVGHRRPVGLQRLGGLAERVQLGPTVVDQDGVVVLQRPGERGGGLVAVLVRLREHQLGVALHRLDELARRPGQVSVSLHRSVLPNGPTPLGLPDRQASQAGRASVEHLEEQQRRTFAVVPLGCLNELAARRRLGQELADAIHADV